MTNPERLIADIGGTNARFACSRADGSVHGELVHPIADFADFSDALDAYLSTLGWAPNFTSAAVAAAGPVARDEVALTNNAWRISAAQLVGRLGTNVKVRLINDLEAVALAIPFLGEQDVEFSDCVPQTQGDRMLAVNLGTGFGAASLIRTQNGWISCASEAGHMVLGAMDNRELDLFQRASDKDMTVEDILSGDGVRNLARLLGMSDASPFASGSTEIVTRILARVSASLTLASAAWGGLYFCGSVATAWWQVADRSVFRDHFCGRSRMRDQLEMTPVGLIKTDHPAFVGLANLKV